MVNLESIPDGCYRNLFCPECQARPNDLETHTDREGWWVLRCAYCLSSLNAMIDALVITRWANRSMITCSRPTRSPIFTRHAVCPESPNHYTAVSESHVRRRITGR